MYVHVRGTNRVSTRELVERFTSAGMSMNEKLEVIKGAVAGGLKIVKKQAFTFSICKLYHFAKGGRQATLE